MESLVCRLLLVSLYGMLQWRLKLPDDHSVSEAASLCRWSSNYSACWTWWTCVQWMTWVRDTLWTFMCDFNSIKTIVMTCLSHFIRRRWWTTAVFACYEFRFINHGWCATSYLKAVSALWITQPNNICIWDIFNRWTWTNTVWKSQTCFCAKGLWWWWRWINHCTFWAWVVVLFDHQGSCCANECECLNNFHVCLCLFFNFNL